MPYWAALRARLAGLRERASDGLARAVAADHTTHEIAATFALGTVVVVLPTAGTALVVFAAVAYLFERASKLALAATLVVYNPPVKWTIYGASYWLGTAVLGPAPGVTPSPAALERVSLSAGRAVLVRQLFGNAVVAVGLAAVGYLVVRGSVAGYRRRRDAGDDSQPSPRSEGTDPYADE